METYLAVSVVLCCCFGLWLLLRKRHRKVEAKGKAVLITGAASGFGLATTKLLTSRGSFVFAVDVNEANLQKHFADNANVKTLVCDVSKTAEVERLYEEVKEVRRHRNEGSPTLYGLVNNAGIAIPAVSVIELDENDMKRVVEINTYGMWRMTKTFFPLLEKDHHDKSCIVNVTSVSGLIAAGFAGAYSMSKYAAEAFSDTLRREIKATGVRVAIIEPCFANTRLLDVLQQHTDKDSRFYPRIQKAIGIVAQTRLLPPEAIAEVIAESLFSDPCSSRSIVAFPKDRFLVFLMCIFPDSWKDKALELAFQRASS